MNEKNETAKIVVATIIGLWAMYFIGFLNAYILFK